MSVEECTHHQEQRSWAKVSGVGPKTATVITQAMDGQVPEYLQKLREEKQPLVEGGLNMRAAIKGDLHCHSSWSDGGSPLEEMMITAQALGHEYCAITDHSPRLQVARGLSADRLRNQLALVADLNSVMAPFRCLRGIEVDILEDGGLDQEDELLAELDVVVSSVHSKLRSDSETMTHRMVGGIANPRTNILGHCTGRLIQGERGVRPQSVFDAEVVFEACRTFNVAVEINSRPERRDPPTRLLQMAMDMDCLFSIDTDAHAPGQLEFQIYGCQRAEELGLDPDRVDQHVASRQAAGLVRQGLTHSALRSKPVWGGGLTCGKVAPWARTRSVDCAKSRRGRSVQRTQTDPGVAVPERLLAPGRMLLAISVPAGRSPRRSTSKLVRSVSWQRSAGRV